MLFDEFFEGDGHFFLDRARVVDVAGDAEKLCAGVAFTAERVEPVWSATENSRSDGNGLNVGDCGRTAEKTDCGGEWRLKTRLSGLAFERLDERCLFTTDVCTHAAVEEDVEVEARAASVLAEEACLICFHNGALKDGGFVVEFSADVDVGSCAVHGATGDETTFDELVGVFAHDFAVLTGTGFTFVGINDEVARFGVLIPILCVHE